MDYKDLYINQVKSHYCTAKELQYSAVYNYFLSPKQVNDYYEFKDIDELNSYIKDIIHSQGIINIVYNYIQKETEETIFNRINRDIKSKCLINVGTLNFDELRMRHNGLAPAHSYCLLDCEEMFDGLKMIKLHILKV